MKNRFLDKLFTAAGVVGMLSLASAPLMISQAPPAAPAAGQGQPGGRGGGAPGGAAPGGARGARGGGAPAAPTPRLPDGTPNLGSTTGKGYWDPPHIESLAYPREAGGPQVDVPYQPWAKALLDYRFGSKKRWDPEGFCLPPGGPRQFATPYPIEIIQQPELKRIFILFEGGAHVWREIYMDGRPHPDKDHLFPTWFGHSVGHWEGDVLVVDSVGYNEGTYLDNAGNPHTDQLHVIERISRTDFNTLRYEYTIDDPGAYTKPWSNFFTVRWNANNEMLEYICQENNRLLEDIIDDHGNNLITIKH